MKSTKKTKKLNIIKVSFVAIIMIAIALYSCWAIISLIKHPTDTFLIEEGKLELAETVTGYIIREETVVQGQNYKNGIVRIKEEGEKVAKSDPIFRYQSNREEELVEKIAELDVEIQEALQNETNIFPRDVVLLETHIKEILDSTYKLNNIQLINKNKSDINSYITKKAKIAGELSPSGSYIKKLVNKRSEYENELNSNSEYLEATTGGVVSYRIDGYETVLSSENLESIDIELLKSLELKTGQLVEQSEEAAKIVNNYEAYIAVVISTPSAMNAKEGQKVTLQLNTNEEVPARIEKIVDESDNRLIIFKVTKGVEDLVSYRKISLQIIWWSSSGLRVPNSSIITEGKLNYVVRNKAGYKDKILVKVLKQNSSYSIIGNYDTNELKELGFSTTEIRSTGKISLYDEIVLNPT